MNKLDNKEEIIGEIIGELSDQDFLVCTEGKERFWNTNGHYNDMSKQRTIAVLKHEICERYDLKMKRFKSDPPPWKEGEPHGIALFVIEKVLTKNAVKEALEHMPGWPTGITEWDDERFLVRRGLTPVTPQKGNWKELRTMIETFFGSHTEDPHYEIQIHAFYCLLRMKLLQMSSSNNDRGLGPMLVLMSEANTGKSFLMRLIALLLGGTERTVDPSKEKNGWSDSCLSSPVIFYDEASREEFDFSSGMNREKFAEFFKGMEYSTHAEIARRGYTARSWPAVWLWARALNTNSRAAILQTPIPDENAMEDKLILARVYRAEMPYPNKEDSETRAKRLNLLKDQLPAFSYWLLNEFPNEMVDDYLRDPEGKPYRNEAHPSIHPDVLEVLTSSENDSAKSITVENYLKACSVEGLFTAGQLLAEANRLASDIDSLAPEPKALMKMFKSGLSLGRTLSQMTNDPSSGITRHASGNTNRYEYEPLVNEDTAAA